MTFRTDKKSEMMEVVLEVVLKLTDIENKLMITKRERRRVGIRDDLGVWD